MIPSSTSTTAAATATVDDGDTNSVVSDNQALFQADTSPNRAADDLSSICEESSPDGSLDSQTMAVEV